MPGGTPLFKPYRYVPAQGVWFLRRFGLKSCMVFERITSVSTYLSFQFQMSKEGREICEFEMEFKKSFLLLLYLINGGTIN